MDEPRRVKNIETVIEDVKLSAWVIDPGETVTIGGKAVEFIDPAGIKIEKNVIPREPETMARMVAAQELRKAVGERKDVFAYLFYKVRPLSHPFIAIMVEDEKKEVQVKTEFRMRPFVESDFGQTDGFCKHEGGEGLIYPSQLWESNDSFRRRMEQFPEGCIACVNDRDELVGYMFCHPWKKDSIVPLNCEDLVIPNDADCFYVHDIAVIPSYRLRGIARSLMFMAIDMAAKHGFDEIKGVAVLGSHVHWIKLGFEVVEEIDYGGVKGVVIVKRLSSQTC
jgi:GNAT superfamily N-acetyltransferase